jgi:hypothetical protein
MRPKIFLIQHYILYPSPRNGHEKAGSEERRELLMQDEESSLQTR